MATSILSGLSRATVALSIVAAPLFFACSDDDPSPTPTGDAGADAGSSNGGGDGGGDGGGGGGGGGNGCGGLCKSSGFTDGDETDYGGGVIECQCAGTGGSVVKSACEAYCAPFGVGADKSFVTKEGGDDVNKCVCDGT